MPCYDPRVDQEAEDMKRRSAILTLFVCQFVPGRKAEPDLLIQRLADQWCLAHEHVDLVGSHATQVRSVPAWREVTGAVYALVTLEKRIYQVLLDHKLIGEL
jgi:hypothetical protein